LNGQVVDDSLDAGDLGGVGCGEGAGGVTADCAVEGCDLFLDRGLNGFGGESAVAGDAGLEGGGQAGVVGGSRGGFAAGEAKDERERCGGQN
jgi:hypothetical protein